MKKWLIIASFVLCTLFGGVAEAANDAPIDLKARTITHDEDAQIVTASGEVELVQGARILNADQITYELQNDTVTAIGNVSLMDEDGRVHFAEYLQLSNQMKDGFLHGLTSLLEEGSRFTAVEVERKDETLVTMTDAAFTPCKICENEPDKKPLWQIKADKITYDQEAGNVKYKNARLEMFGVPLAYSPIFSHPDPRIKQKSGFLRPSVGWSSELGTSARSGYYWAVSETQDVTAYVQPTTRQGVLGEVEYRKNFDNGYIRLNPTVALNSNRTEEDDRVEEDLTRASIEGDARINLTDKWRAGFDVHRASDKEYLRLYELDYSNVLENVVFAERFDGRHYTNLNAQHFQDIRLGDREEQPDIAPSLSHEMIGAPNSLWGGRLEGEVSYLGLRRSDEGQDVDRASADLAWQFDHITRHGIVAKAIASTRVDHYNVQDLEAAIANPALDSDFSDTRVLPQLHTEASYPLVKNGNRMQWVVEPRVAFTAAPQLSDDNIPNEDSLDVRLDALNLFAANRFPGEDVQEDGTRVTYGVSNGFYGYNQGYARAFIGQSYRFDDDALFPEGSGLSESRSDYVGSFSAGYGDRFDAEYLFQLSEDNLQPQRHEARMQASFDKFDIGGRYTFARVVDGTGFNETREQVSANTGYRFNDNWSATASGLMDLGQDPGLRTAGVGLQYTDECFNFGIQGVRRIVDRSTGQSETSILMRLGFKYLGEFNVPQILVQQETAE